MKDDMFKDKIVYHGDEKWQDIKEREDKKQKEEDKQEQQDKKKQQKKEDK